MAVSHRSRMIIVAPATVAAVAALAFCARWSETLAAGDSPTLSVRRTGGFAGVRDSILVWPDGRWTRADRAGARRSGRLTASQQRRLRELLADPRLPGESRRPVGPARCPDAFNYLLRIGSMRIRYEDCESGPDLPQAGAAVVALIESATSG